MFTFVRNVGKSIGIAALLCIVTYVAFAISLEILNRMSKVDEMGEIGFVIGFILTIHFPIMSLFYLLVLSITPVIKWINQHSIQFQLSIVIAGIGMGYVLSLEGLINRQFSATFLLVLTLISLLSLLSALLGSLYAVIFALPWFEQSFSTKIMNGLVAFILILGFLALIFIPLATKKFDNLLFGVLVEVYILLSISPYIAWILLDRYGHKLMNQKGDHLGRPF